jgi:N-glycosylase/DNA lyase
MKIREYIGHIKRELYRKPDGEMMIYRGYKIAEVGNNLVVEGVRDFNTVHTFECGQCFRWNRCSDGSHTGIVRDKPVNILVKDGILRLKNCSSADFQTLWYDYLDLGRDYADIKARLTEKDEILAKAVEFGWGIRLLRQDLWETLISFILSTNKKIAMIMKMIAALSKIYGRELVLEGESFYTFPDMETLAESCLRDLEACGGGYRCKYISGTAKMIREGVVELDKLKAMSTSEARQTLTLLSGVGNKVADCTLLFSGTKYDAFPVDVWVKRVMEELYFKREASFKEIQEFAADYFGELAGFAQQYLFYYARENRIGAG